MPILKEQYPDSHEDLRKVFSWVARKVRARLHGEPYEFTPRDFQDMSRWIRYSNNCLAPRLSHLKWYQRMVDSVFGPVENPKIQSRVIPLTARGEKSKNAVLPYEVIDDCIEGAGFRVREVGFFCPDMNGLQFILAEYPEKHPATVAAWEVQGPSDDQ